MDQGGGCAVGRDGVGGVEAFAQCILIVTCCKGIEPLRSVDFSLKI